MNDPFLRNLTPQGPPSTSPTFPSIVRRARMDGRRGVRWQAALLCLLVSLQIVSSSSVDRAVRHEQRTRAAGREQHLSDARAAGREQHFSERTLSAASGGIPGKPKDACSTCNPAGGECEGGVCVCNDDYVGAGCSVNAAALRRIKCDKDKIPEGMLAACRKTTEKDGTCESYRLNADEVCTHTCGIINDQSSCDKAAREEACAKLAGMFCSGMCDAMFEWFCANQKASGHEAKDETAKQYMDESKPSSDI